MVGPATGRGSSTHGAPVLRSLHPLIAMIPKVVRMEKVKAKTSRTYRSSCDAWKRTSTSHPNAVRLSPARGGRRPTRLS